MKRILYVLSAAALALLLLGGVTASAENSAPVAENLELRTYRNVSVGGQMSAFDPEGESCRFEITTNPVKGELLTREDGKFVYTPQENKRGRDYFGYKAIDAQGNYSQEATVIIRIEKRKKDVAYADLRGSEDEYAAVALCENGLFTGQRTGRDYCFEPESEVSRGEFLSMCMELLDKPLFSGVCRTGYLDEDSIPDWQKGYAVTASAFGIYRGQTTPQGRVFSADEPISKAEAALILDRLMELNKVSYLPPDVELEAEQAQACMNMSAYGMLDKPVQAKELLMRIEAARMLAAALELLAK